MPDFQRGCTNNHNKVNISVLSSITIFQALQIQCCFRFQIVMTKLSWIFLGFVLSEFLAAEAAPSPGEYWDKLLGRGDQCEDVINKIFNVIKSN